MFCGNVVYSRGLCKICHCAREKRVSQVKKAVEWLKNSPDYYEVDHIIDRKDFVLWLFSGLTELERNILSQRNGIPDGEDRTLAQVAAFFNISAERVRQQEARSYRKLRRKISKLDFKPQPKDKQ